jgi:hypothetical protein
MATTRTLAVSICTTQHSEKCQALCVVKTMACCVKASQMFHVLHILHSPQNYNPVQATEGVTVDV